VPDHDATKIDETVSAKSFFTENGCSVKALLILCHVLLRDDGTPTLNVCEEPWSKMNKKLFPPTPRSSREKSFAAGIFCVLHRLKILQTRSLLVLLSGFSKRCFIG
jgi:hypothetical protein